MSTFCANHNIFCAILTCAEGILSNGLETLIIERQKEAGMIYNAEQLCQIISSLMLAQSENIMHTLERLIKQHNCMNNINDVLTRTTSIRSPRNYLNSTNLSFCKESNGNHGRMLCTTQGVGLGHILLQETPYCICITNSCQCKVNSILTEHLAIACTIQRSIHSNTIQYQQFLNTFYSGLLIPTHIIDNTTSVHTNKYKYKNNNNTTNTTTSTGAGTANSSQYTRSDSINWSLHMHLLYAIISSIICIYEAHTEYIHNYGPLQNITTILHNYTIKNNTYNNIKTWKQSLFHNSYILMQILSRLPHNTHAISKIIEKNNGNNKEIEQKRVGFAVFLIASSINHSCQPNSIIRFKYDTEFIRNYNNSSGGSTSGGSNNGSSGSSSDNNNSSSSSGGGGSSSDNSSMLLQYLRSVQIEIVSTMSIMYSTNHTTTSSNGTSNSSSTIYDTTTTTTTIPNEITVSYGPIHTQHTLSKRQYILYTQYLFNCTCTACIHDININIEYNKQQKQKLNKEFTQYSMNNSINTINNIIKNHKNKIKNLNNIKYDSNYLSHELISIRELLIEYNTLYTKILYYYNNNHNNITLLYSFEEKKLIPMKTRLNTLQNIYFPQLKEVLISSNNRNIVYTIYSIYKNDPLYKEYCSIYCIYLDMHAYIYSIYKKYTIAIDYIYTSILLFIDSGLYNPDDINIARDRVKLAGLLCTVSNWKSCVVQVQCALRVLVPLVSADDPDVTEAQCIHTYCLQHPSSS